MIRLTKVNGEAWYVNPEQIVDFGNDSEYVQTLVQTTKNGWYVTESPEEVARKVLEWRLAMEDYRIYTKRASIDGDYDVANSHYDELKRLAGLEEQA